MSSITTSQSRPRLAGIRMVSLWTLVSRVLGFARDSAMAGAFGLGEILDAFTLAFRIPNLARSLFGEGALATAFLPVFVDEHQKRGELAARRLATAVFLRLLILLAVIVGLAEIALVIVRVTTPLTPYNMRLVDLLAIMTPYLLLICLTALCSAMLQALGRFGWPAFVPALLNVWWLTAVLLVTLFVVNPEWRIRAVATALLVGGCLQFFLPASVLWKSGWKPCRDDGSAAPTARLVFRAMAPTILATSIAQFNTVLDTALAWLLASPDSDTFLRGGGWIEPGTAAALYFAQRLYQFPMGLIGIATGTVLYPTLAAHASAKNFERLKDDLTHGLSVALSVAIPASAGLVVLAGPITSALFQHGKFDEHDALLTSRITAIYGSASWGAIALLLIQRGFFSVGDRITPLKTGLIAVSVNLILTLLGAWFGGGTGLAIATATTAVFHLLLSLFFLRSHVVSLDWHPLSRCLAKTILATTVMAIICVVLRDAMLPRGGRYLALLVPIGIGGPAFLAAAWLLKLQEPWELLARRRPAPHPETLEEPTPHAPMETDPE